MALSQSFLTQITNVHFPALWPFFGVYVKVTPVPNGLRWATPATANLGGAFSGSILGSGGGVGQVINPYTVPADPGFALGQGTSADARFIAPGSPGNSTLNLQGSRIVRLNRGQAYSGSVTVARSQTFVGVTPIPTMNVSVILYILRLVPGTTMTFSSGGSAISLPVTTVLGSLSYVLASSGSSPPQSRTDNFSFTAP